MCTRSEYDLYIIRSEYDKKMVTILLDVTKFESLGPINKFDNCLK